MKKYDWVALIVVVAVIIGIVGAYVLHFHNSSISNNTSDWGDFGAYVSGGLSLISVCLIYYTYRKQSEMNYRNQFESKFFEMLNRQREIYRDVEAVNLFSQLRDEIKAHFLASFSYKLTKDEAEKLFTYYFNLHISSKEVSLHYFRHLYHIVKYVHNDPIISPEDKKAYIDMVQAGMSDDELFVSFINAIWWHFGSAKREYLDWLDDYSFFENLQSPGEWFDNCKKQLFTKTQWKHDTDILSPNAEIYTGEEDDKTEHFQDTLERLEKSKIKE